MINKSYVLILFGLLLIIVISAVLYFGIRSPALHILLAIGFIIVGAGIILGFFKMVSGGRQ